MPAKPKPVRGAGPVRIEVRVSPEMAKELDAAVRAENKNRKYNFTSRTRFVRRALRKALDRC